MMSVQHFAKKIKEALKRLGKYIGDLADDIIGLKKYRPTENLGQGQIGCSCWDWLICQLIKGRLEVERERANQ